MIKYNILLILVWTLSASLPIHAEVLPLSTALREGLKNHPDILTADANLKIRLAEKLAFTQIPNPILEAEFRTLTGKPAIELRLMQPIKRSYFGLRQNYAIIESASANADARAQVAGVLNDVYSRYVELWIVQELQSIRGKNREDLVSLHEPMYKSVKAGLGGTVELALLDAEIANESTEAEALESQKLARSAALARRIGYRSGNVIVVERPSGLSLPSNSSGLEKFAVKRTPLRLALLKREQAARAQLAIAQSDRFGSIQAGILAEHDTDVGGTFLGLGFAFDLPLWNRNEAAIAGAQASIDAAKGELKQFEPARVAAVVKLRYRSALTAEQSAIRYRSEVVPLFETALSKAQEAMAKGQGGISQIQPIINRLTQTRMRAFELSNAALEARAELEGALGGRLEEALGFPIK
ncbi:MAG: TolC family protein [Verrucomicrobia bacterium]|nr:MAG: TolC family protein [Verrucomicrobiota bacterium]